MPPFQPLAGRARLLFHLQAFSRLAVFWFPLVLVVALFAATRFEPIPVAVAALAVLFGRFLLAVWWPWLSWRRWGYLLRDEELLIQRGVLVRSVTAIPTARIQHVDVRQGPLEQWLGLARLHIHTASGVGGDGVIPGLEHERAETLRDRLVADASEGDDGV